MIHPILVQIQLTTTEKIHQKILKANDMSLHDEFVENLKKRLQLFYHSKNFKRLELGLETTFQLAGQVMLLALSYSDTRTTHGLVSFFKKESFLFIPAEWYLGLSILQSIGSFVWSQTNGLSGHRVYFPQKSKLIIAVSALIACSIRVMAFVLFFSPALGLWNLLRHYQGTQKLKALLTVLTIPFLHWQKCKLDVSCTNLKEDNKISIF